MAIFTFAHTGLFGGNDTKRTIDLYHKVTPKNTCLEVVLDPSLYFGRDRYYKIKSNIQVLKNSSTIKSDSHPNKIIRIDFFVFFE